MVWLESRKEMVWLKSRKTRSLGIEEGDGMVGIGMVEIEEGDLILFVCEEALLCQSFISYAHEILSPLFFEPLLLICSRQTLHPPPTATLSSTMPLFQNRTCPLCSESNVPLGVNLNRILTFPDTPDELP